MNGSEVLFTTHKWIENPCYLPSSSHILNFWKVLDRNVLRKICMCSLLYRRVINASNLGFLRGGLRVVYGKLLIGLEGVDDWNVGNCWPTTLFCQSKLWLAATIHVMNFWHSCNYEFGLLPFCFGPKETYLQQVNLFVTYFKFKFRLNWQSI